jgi:hypothetical protein
LRSASTTLELLPGGTLGLGTPDRTWVHNGYYEITKRYLVTG